MINLYNVDCMAFMKSLPDKAYELAIVDPPYGLGKKLITGGGWAKRWQQQGVEWDVVPNKEYLNEIMRVSQNWIIWGGNYFIEYLPNCRNFIAWHKPYMDGMQTMSNVELALTSFDKNAKKISLNKDDSGHDKIHVTQKPVKLYKYLLKHFASSGDRILDTHGGSMSIAIACYDLGYSLDLCELDADYYRAGKQRLDDHIAKYAPAHERPVNNTGQIKLL